MKHNNHKIQLFLLTLCIGLGLNLSHAQIAINNSDATPDASAMLDISSSDKGLLAPRMSRAERKNISSPATGLLVYDTDENAFFYYNGTAWESIRNEYYGFGDNQSDETTECQKVLPDDGVADDQFGAAISLWDNYALVGAPTQNSNIGAVYIFENINGTWTQQSTLSASDGVANDVFGATIVMTETYAFISAYGVNSNTGAVYVFERSGDTWTEIDKLEADDGQANSVFGTSLAISGDYLAIGALYGNGTSGAVYVFQQSGGVWTQHSKLVASDFVQADFFGQAVAISESKIVVGAPASNQTGAAYIFELSEGIWSEQSKLEGETNDLFGFAVGIYGEQIIVGAPDHEGTGAVLIHEHDGVSWVEKEELTPWGDTQNSSYGIPLVITDDKMMVGANGYDISNSHAGAAYIYNYTNESWQLETQFIPADPSFEPRMGTALALSDDFALVGAVNDSENGTAAGAVYTYCPQVNDYLDNTDDQEMALDGSTLSIENGNAIDLSTALSDNQTIDRLDLNNSGENLRLSLQSDGEGNKILSLTGYFDNTDQQELSITDNTLSITDGGSVDLSDFKDLGTHTASASVNTNLQKISGDGGDEGMSIDTDGNLTIASTSSTASINIIPPTNSQNTYVHFNDESGNPVWKLGTNTSSGHLIFEDAVTNTQPVVIEAGAENDALTISSEGNVGIGIGTATNAKFEVNGHLSKVINNYTYLSNVNSSYEHISSNTDEKEVSIYATERIVGKFVISMSDERIKKIQGISDNQEDLATLQKIKITDYEYIDKVKEGNTQQKKVIAQQVAEVYPQAVNKQFTEVVPDIYQKATMDEKGWVNLATDLKVGETVQVIFEQGKALLEVLSIKENMFQINVETLNFNVSELNPVFVYGRQVEDFHTVDYDAISMLNVSATQQLAKENEELKQIAAKQEQQIKMLEERRAKLKALEAAVGEWKM